MRLWGGLEVSMPWTPGESSAHGTTSRRRGQAVLGFNATAAAGSSTRKAKEAVR